MTRRIDKTQVLYAENLIAIGLTSPQIVRRMVDEFNISTPTAYRYIDLAFDEVALLNKPVRAKKLLQAELMIASDRARALKARNLTEAGRCVDRFIKIHGLDRIVVEQATDSVAADAISTITRLMRLTPSELETKEKALLDELAADKG